MGKCARPVSFLDRFLAERGEAVTYYPGGCVIGKRPIDLHLYALKRLGASFFEAGGMILARADRLRGAQDPVFLLQAWEPRKMLSWRL